MQYITNLNTSVLTNARILTKTDETYQIPLTIGAMTDAFDDHSGGIIDTTKWSAQGSVTEGAFLGIDCLRTAGPSSPAWDTDGVIYKPAIIPSATIQSIVGCFLLNTGGKFAVGLQEYAFTVNDIVTPTTWTLKYDTAQTADNSVYVVFDAGKVYIYRGGSSGQRIIVSTANWAISETTNVKPIFVCFYFSSNGYQIVLSQAGVNAAPVVIHTEVRSLGTHPAAGYSFCVNKYFADSTLGFFGLANDFRSDAVVSNYFIAESTAIGFNPSLLTANAVIGGMARKEGAIYYQFPELSSKWYTATELTTLTTLLTGYYAHTINLKLSGDVTVSHPIYIKDSRG